MGVGFPSTTTPLLLNEVGLSLVGMSESGITGINYTAPPQKIDMERNSIVNSQIALQVGNDENSGSRIRPGQYTIMVRATVLDNKDNNSLVSLLYPVQIRLDVPPSAQVLQQQQSQQTYPNTVSNNYQVPVNGFIDSKSLGGILRTLALLLAIGLIAYAAYRRVERSRRATQKHQQQER
jgi:hypothetical protein